MLTRDVVAFAMMNRDHGLDDPMLVSIFPDRLTITSPGGGMTVCAPDESMIDRLLPRNRGLADVMYRLKIIADNDVGAHHIYDPYRACQ